MRLLSAIRFDMKSQFRHGFYLAYALVTVLYIGLLLYIPEEMQHTAKILILFSDPVVLGCYFIGGIFLLERGQNILDSLFVTPLRIHEYIVSKVISLTILTLVSAFAIVLVLTGLDFHPISLGIGMFLGSCLFTLIGFVLAVRSRSLNSYLMTSPAYVIVFFLPVLEILNIYSSVLLRINPGYSVLILLSGSFHGITTLELLLHAALLLIWIGIVYWWAYTSFVKRVVVKIGENNG